MENEKEQNKSQNGSEQESKNQEKSKKQINCTHADQRYYCFTNQEYECAECYKKLEKQKIDRVVISVEQLKQVDLEINKEVNSILIKRLLSAKSNITKSLETQIKEARDLEQRLYHELFNTEKKKFFGTLLMQRISLKE